MTRRLLIECGAAETRAAFVENGVVTHFWFGPARGDESLPRPPETGDIFAGRVKTVSKALNAAFVDIGAGEDAFLPVKKSEKPPVEGTRAAFLIRRPPLDGKGAVLSSQWRKGLAADAIANIEKSMANAAIGSISNSKHPVTAAIAHCAPESKFDEIEIVVNDAIAKRSIESCGFSRVAFADNPFADEDIDAAIDESLFASIDLPGGARLRIQETAAGAMFDIDSAGAAGARLNDKMNLAALNRILIELSRRSIGGRVIIDFLPPTNAGARSSLTDALKSGLKRFDRARLGRIAPDGLADITLPRERRSLLERSTEPAGGDWPIAGRRFTLDWSAKAAICALERILRSQPAARPRLNVGAEITDYLEQDRPQWRARLIEKFGARFDIARGDALKSRTYDLAE